MLLSPLYSHDNTRSGALKPKVKGGYEPLSSKKYEYVAQHSFKRLIVNSWLSSMNSTCLSHGDTVTRTAVTATTNENESILKQVYSSKHGQMSALRFTK